MGADLRRSRGSQGAAEARSGKVATLGYCWGGTISWRAAGQLDGIAARSATTARRSRPIRAEQPRCPVLMHFGDKDPIATLEACRRAARGAGRAGRNPGLSGRPRLQLRRNPRTSRGRARTLALRRSLEFLADPCRLRSKRCHDLWPTARRAIEPTVNAQVFRQIRTDIVTCQADAERAPPRREPSRALRRRRQPDPRSADAARGRRSGNSRAEQGLSRFAGVARAPAGSDENARRNRRPGAALVDRKRRRRLGGQSAWPPIIGCRIRKRRCGAAATRSISSGSRSTATFISALTAACGSQHC